MNIKQAALYYAKHGWYVYPTLDKHPIIKGIGPNQASRDSAIIESWFTKFPNAQISIATGRKSNLFVVDLDNKNNVRGSDTWEKLFGTVPITLTQSTPHNGFHLFFTYPEDLPKSIELKCTVQRIGPGIDTRGEKGACVIAPSQGYIFLDRSKPIPVPEYLIEFFKPKEKPLYIPKNRIHSTDKYANSALHGILLDMQNATEGSRNHVLNALAYRIGRLTHRGQIPEYAGEDLQNLAISMGLNETEVRETFKSGFNAGLKAG